MIRRYLSKIFEGIKSNPIAAGVIGGLLVTILSPFILPPITSLQASTGAFVDQPDVNVEVRGGPTEVVQINNHTYPAENQTDTYTVSIHNSENRLANDVIVTLYFQGCAEERGFRVVNGSVYTDPGIQFRSTNCVETVYVPSLAEGETISLEYNVNSTSYVEPPNSMVAIGEDHFMAYSVEYHWSLNGMDFYHEGDIIRLKHEEIQPFYGTTRDG